MMLRFLKSFKKAPPIPTWHFTKNLDFIGAKDTNVICYLNKSHLLLSCKGIYHIATPDLIPKASWNKLLSPFDHATSAIETDLVVVTELNETCENVLEELTLEPTTAGLHNVID